MTNHATRRKALKSTGAAIVASFAGCIGSSGGNTGTESLRYLDFGGNTQESVMEVFSGWAEENDVEIKQTSASGTTEQISLMKQNPDSFDIIGMNDTGTVRAMNEDLIKAIDVDKIPNHMENMREGAQGLVFQMDGSDVKAIMREMGGTGYAYNTEKIDQDLSSWNDIKRSEFEGKVSLIDWTADRLTNCAVTIGLDINSVPNDQAKTDQVFAEAKKQDENVFSYWSDGATSVRYLREENAWICEAWAGRILALQEEGYEHIEYVVPDEGGAGWAGNFVIGKGTSNDEAIYDLLNYTYQRENLLTLSDKLGYMIQVTDPPEKMKQLPDYAPIEDFAFRDWKKILPVQDQWTERLEKVKQS